MLDGNCGGLQFGSSIFLQSMSVMASSLLIFHLFNSRSYAGTYFHVFLFYIRRDMFVIMKILLQLGQYFGQLFSCQPCFRTAATLCTDVGQSGRGPAASVVQFCSCFVLMRLHRSCPLIGTMISLPQSRWLGIHPTRRWHR